MTTATTASAVPPVLDFYAVPTRDGGFDARARTADTVLRARGGTPEDMCRDVMRGVRASFRNRTNVPGAVRIFVLAVEMRASDADATDSRTVCRGPYAPVADEQRVEKGVFSYDEEDEELHFDDENCDGESTALPIRVTQSSLRACAPEPSQDPGWPSDSV